MNKILTEENFKQPSGFHIIHVTFLGIFHINVFIIPNSVQIIELLMVRLKKHSLKGGGQTSHVRPYWKRTCYPLKDEVQIIDNKHRWRVRKLKEVADIS